MQKSPTSLEALQVRPLDGESTESMAPESLVQFLSTDYKFAVSFVILVIVLLVRPTGIFSGKSL